MYHQVDLSSLPLLLIPTPLLVSISYLSLLSILSPFISQGETYQGRPYFAGFQARFPHGRS